MVQCTSAIYSTEPINLPPINTSRIVYSRDFPLMRPADNRKSSALSATNCKFLPSHVKSASPIVIKISFQPKTRSMSHAVRPCLPIAIWCCSVDFWMQLSSSRKTTLHFTGTNNHANNHVNNVYLGAFSTELFPTHALLSITLASGKFIKSYKGYGK